MVVEPYLHPDLTLVIEGSMTRSELFDRLTAAVDDLIPSIDGAELKRLLESREAQGPTSTPEGVAFPHAMSAEIDRTMIVAIRVLGGVDFGVPNHPRADMVFALFGSPNNPWDHVRLLARLARLMHTDEARQRVRGAKTAEALYQHLLEEDRAHG